MMSILGCCILVVFAFAFLVVTNMHDILTINRLKRGYIEFKYYADAILIHSDLTPPG